MARPKKQRIDIRETIVFEALEDAVIAWPGPDAPRHKECTRCLRVHPMEMFKRLLTLAQSAKAGYSGERRVLTESSICRPCRQQEAKDKRAMDRRPRVLRMSDKQIANAAYYGDIHPLVAQDMLRERRQRINGARSRAQHDRWLSEWQAPFRAAQKEIIKELAAARNQQSYAKRQPGATNTNNFLTPANQLLSYAQTHIAVLRQLHNYYGLRADQVTKDPATHWPVLREQPEVWDKHRPGSPAEALDHAYKHRSTSVRGVTASPGAAPATRAQQLNFQLFKKTGVGLPAYRTPPQQKENTADPNLDPTPRPRGQPRRHPAPEEFRREVRIEAAGTSLEKAVLVPVLAPWWHPEAAERTTPGTTSDTPNPVVEARRQLQIALDRAAAASPQLLTTTRFRYPTLLTPLTTLDIPDHRLRSKVNPTRDATNDALTRAQQGWHNKRAQRAQKGR